MAGGAGAALAQSAPRANQGPHPTHARQRAAKLEQLRQTLEAAAEVDRGAGRQIEQIRREIADAKTIATRTANWRRRSARRPSTQQNRCHATGQSCPSVERPAGAKCRRTWWRPGIFRDRSSCRQRRGMKIAGWWGQLGSTATRLVDDRLQSPPQRWLDRQTLTAAAASMSSPVQSLQLRSAHTDRRRPHARVHRR